MDIDSVAALLGANIVNFVQLDGNASGTGCDFVFDYPIPQNINQKYHAVVVSSGNHQILAVQSSDIPANNSSQEVVWAASSQLETLASNGVWNIISGSLAFAGMQFYARYPLYPATVPLQYISQSGGIDTLDFITPCLSPNGTAITYGMYDLTGAFYILGPIASATSPGQANLLSNRPSTVGPSIIIPLGTVIDLGTSASGFAQVNTAKQTAEFIEESPAYAWATSVTTITDTVTLVGFNPTYHTYSETLETGRGSPRRRHLRV